MDILKFLKTTTTGKAGMSKLFYYLMSNQQNKKPMQFLDDYQSYPMTLWSKVDNTNLRK